MTYTFAWKSTKKQTHSMHTSHNKPGFSFPEMILVIGIISMLMLFLLPRINLYRKQSKVAQTKLELRQLRQAIDQYHSDTNQYPSTLTDLVKKPADVKNWNSEYAPKKSQFKDAWGNKLKYERNPEEAEHPYELFSYGPEGRKKGSKADAISVWDEE